MGDWYKLLPGLRWSGRLRVLVVEVGSIHVEFDARAVNGDYIYDRTPLTPKQFTDWTGEPPPEGSLPARTRARRRWRKKA